MIKTEGLGKKKIRIYETYKNKVIPHGRHIYAKAYEMVNEKICAYSQSDHTLPHWKCIFQCCAKFPRINIPDQDIDGKNPNPSPSIHFHIYHLIHVVQYIATYFLACYRKPAMFCTTCIR